MCQFIGWSTANSNAEDWGNYKNVVSASFENLWHSGDNTTWNQENGNASKALNSVWVSPAGTFVTARGNATVKKNIYDVAGNVWEWTTEQPKLSDNNAVLRGGGADNDSSTVFATMRAGHIRVDVRSWCFGFRFVLYVAGVE